MNVPKQDDQPTPARVEQPAGEGGGASERDVRQKQVHQWAVACFGSGEASSLPQRGIRLLEEAAEAAQATGVTLDKAKELMAYVWARPAGNISQELGGVGVTTLALAEAAGVSAESSEITEVQRILSKPREHFAQRNTAKNDAGFKVAAPTPPATGEAANLLLTPGENLPIKGSIYEQYPKPPTPVGDVEQAELPPLVNMPNLIRAYGRFTPESSQAYDDEKIKQRERQLRAERAAHKATREQLEAQAAQHTKWVAKQAVHLFEIGLRSSDKLGVWRNDRAESAEAENQELRRKLEGRAIMEFDLDQEGSQL